jgi:hypothetical protein
MKKITIFLVLAMCFAMIGCSKDAEINAFLTEWEGVTNDMVKKIDEGDVDGAKTVFDAKKDSLKAKVASIKDARGFQVSEATKKNFEDAVTKNTSTLTGAMTRNAMKLATDKTKMDKLQALMKEYGEIFTK